MRILVLFNGAAGASNSSPPTAKSVDDAFCAAGNIRRVHLCKATPRWRSIVRLFAVT